MCSRDISHGTLRWSSVCMCWTSWIWVLIACFRININIHVWIELVLQNPFTNQQNHMYSGVQWCHLLGVCHQDVSQYAMMRYAPFSVYFFEFSRCNGTYCVPREVLSYTLTANHHWWLLYRQLNVITHNTPSTRHRLLLCHLVKLRLAYFALNLKTPAMLYRLSNTSSVSPSKFEAGLLSIDLNNPWSYPQINMGLA
jgi:hypothetical protein